MFDPHHTCPEDTAIEVQALCPGTTQIVGASDVFILLAVVLLLAAVGWVLWNVSRKRFIDDFSEEPGDEEEE